MKKIFILLVALVGFGISVNAQARITDVSYSSNTITVTVEKTNGYSNCDVSFKIYPTNDMLVIAVGGDYTKAKYGKITSSNTSTKITYSCAAKVDNAPQACQVYNFTLDDLYVTGSFCPEDKKSK